MLTKNQQDMVYWITERESIRLKKEQGLPAPWSDEKAMQEVYFCNVNREDDKVTKWIRQHWLYPNYMDEYEQSFDTKESYDFAMIAARIFNLPATLQEIGQPIDGLFELEEWLFNTEDVLLERKARGDKIWNGAYIISTNGKKIDKITYCLDLLKKVAINPQITHNSSTLAEAHKALMQVDGLASFLAAQVVADLKNTVNHPLNKAPDWWTFSAPGPGSLRGLEWFWEENVTGKNYQEMINQAYGLLQFELPDSILKILCMQNLQNCFCEYDKFMRVTKGVGRSKRKYNGTGKQ